MISELGVPLPALDMTEPRSYMGNLLSGGLGFGLGAALGAKLAAPDREVITTVGDGSYMFGNPLPYHYVGRAESLPTLTIIANNSMWGAVRQSTLDVYPDGKAAKANIMPLTELRPSPDFEKVVESCGGYGEKVETADAVMPALERALDKVRSGTPATLNVMTQAHGGSRLELACGHRWRRLALAWRCASAAPRALRPVTGSRPLRAEAATASTTDSRDQCAALRRAHRQFLVAIDDRAGLRAGRPACASCRSTTAGRSDRRRRRVHQLAPPVAHERLDIVRRVLQTARLQLAPEQAGRTGGCPCGRRLSFEMKMEWPVKRSLKPCSSPSNSHFSRNLFGTESWWIDRNRSAETPVGELGALEQAVARPIGGDQQRGLGEAPVQQPLRDLVRQAQVELVFGNAAGAQRAADFSRMTDVHDHAEARRGRSSLEQAFARRQPSDPMRQARRRR